MANMNIDEKSLRAIISNLEKDVARRPKDIATRLQLALSYMRLAERDQAREHLEKVIELDKRNVEANYYLGVLWADTGNLEEAKNAFKRTVALDKSHSPSHYFLGKIYAFEGNLTLPSPKPRRPGMQVRVTFARSQLGELYLAKA